TMVQVLADPAAAAREFREATQDRQFELRPQLTFGERVLGRLRALFGIRPLGTPEYQSGTPWTGWGSLDEVAGIVHRREAVIPWEALRKGPAGVLEFLGVPGFQDGRGEGILRPSIEAARPALEALRPGLAETLLEALDMLSEGVGWVKERFDELMKAIEDGPQAIDDAINSIRDYAEELELAAMQQAAVNTFVAQILGKMPILSQMLQGMHAGALFGPAGSAVGALAALALYADTTAHGFRMVNETLQALANAVGMLLQPLLPLIYVVQSVLVPVFTILGQVLESVNTGTNTDCTT